MSDPRIVIVTGASGTLGGAVASAFAAQGDKVARINYAKAPASPLPGGIDIGGVDLTDPKAAASALATVKAKLGAPAILVNIAGGFAWQTLADGGIDTWHRMFAMNAATCVNMTKAALDDLMQAKGAAIINIGAGGALTAAAGMGAYAASKSAVHRLTESLAAELSGKDVTVNAILPSIIDTPANRAAMPDADTGNWVKPAAIAEVILFLASPAARAISGALIPVSRGS